METKKSVTLGAVVSACILAGGCAFLLSRSVELIRERAALLQERDRARTLILTLQQDRRALQQPLEQERRKAAVAGSDCDALARVVRAQEEKVSSLEKKLVGLKSLLEGSVEQIRFSGATDDTLRAQIEAAEARVQALVRENTRLKQGQVRALRKGSVLAERPVRVLPAPAAQEQRQEARESCPEHNRGFLLKDGRSTFQGPAAVEYLKESRVP